MHKNKRRKNQKDINSFHIATADFDDIQKAKIIEELRQTYGIEVSEEFVKDRFDIKIIN